jgi:hypothetical protein
MRRKDELSPAGVDKGWPHQVALLADKCTGANTAIIHEFCKDLSLCPRGQSVMWEDEWYKVFCFAEPVHAERFMARFGGEPFDQRQRGKGVHWARWKRT